MPSETKPAFRSEELMSAGDSALLVVDVQEKLLPAIEDKETVLSRTRLALRGASILGVPILVTEQYPRGLGKTVPDLASLIPQAFEKVCFSSCGADGVLRQLQDLGVSKVFVTGIEAHVCVQQTALDLLARGYRVYIAADAVGSRRNTDRDWALTRMQNAGAVVTTAEAAVFEWTETAANPKFKEISNLIKETQG